MKNRKVNQRVQRKFLIPFLVVSVAFIITLSIWLVTQRARVSQPDDSYAAVHGTSGASLFFNDAHLAGAESRAQQSGSINASARANLITQADSALAGGGIISGDTSHFNKQNGPLYMAYAYRITGRREFANLAAKLLVEQISSEAPKINNTETDSLAQANEVLMRSQRTTYRSLTFALLKNYDGWSSTDKEKVRSWLQQFGTALKNVYGSRTGGGFTNSKIFHMEGVAAAGLASGDQSLVDYGINRFKTQLDVAKWNNQPVIDSNGFFGHEMSRVAYGDDTWFYAGYSMVGMVTLAEIARNQGIDLYNYQTPSGSSLRKAMLAHVPYIVGERSWPHTTGDVSYPIFHTVFVNSYEIAYAYLQEPAFLKVLNKAGSSRRIKERTERLGPAAYLYANARTTLQGRNSSTPPPVTPTSPTPVVTSSPRPSTTPNSTPLPPGSATGINIVSQTGSWIEGNEVGQQYIAATVSATTATNSNVIEYQFNLTQSGRYYIRALVNAPDLASNSFYVNIDSRPSSDADTWDIVQITQGFEERAVSHRGNGSFDNPQYSPKYFDLSAGTHKLYITAREAGTKLSRISIIKDSTSVTPTSTPQPVGTTGLIKAVNINGNSVLVDGVWYEAYANSGLQVSGTPFANQSIPLTVAVPSDKATMIRSSLWGGNGSLKARLPGMTNGNYKVYMYIWEDNTPQTIGVQVESTTVQSNIYTGSAGTWQKLGPYTATISDTALDVVFTGGHANLSGIEVWSDSVNVPLPSGSVNEQDRTIKVWGNGTAAAGIYPNIKVTVNDSYTAGSFSVTQNESMYTVNVPTSIASITDIRKIKLQFTNDGVYTTSSGTREDRNLYINKIAVAGKEIRANDPTVIQSGVWTSDACRTGNYQTNFIACAGYFEFLL